MKTLVVYDNTGQLIFTQTGATEQYYLTVEDITEDKEVIGVDLSTGKLVTVKADLSDYKKQQKLDELNEKNRVYLLEQNLAKTQAENEELNNEIKKEINLLQQSNLEILDYVDSITEN
ncbi:hypothetical protein [uncultured Clostridium sp.]|uniref:hypothetical protein n=1 Tax=uncultured Clostridium sp. TaxID=59620 RepID=UPI0025ED6752|nr:hypothetical protein [uncultured Clostridium sp.]